MLHRQGDLAGASAAYERALRIGEASFGPDHPNVARDVNNLGGVLHDLGDLVGARAAYERALAICERVLRPEHPNTRTVRGNLESLGGEWCRHGTFLSVDVPWRWRNLCSEPLHSRDWREGGQCLGMRLQNFGGRVSLRFDCISSYQFLIDFASIRLIYRHCLRLMARCKSIVGHICPIVSH